MSRKHRAQHQAKRAQLDHYHALDTGPAEGWDGIDANDTDGEAAADAFDASDFAPRSTTPHAHQPSNNPRG